MPEKAVLVVSFGTTHLDTLEKTIQPIEWDIAARMPGRVQRRAFTSGMILRRLAERGLDIDDVPRALERLAGEGCADVVLQPTHIMNGDEFDKLCAQAEPFRTRFARLSFGRPLLTALEDYRDLTSALMEILPEAEEGTVHVFMGHGTEHFANAAYCQLEYMLHDRGRTDAVVGTVEGWPGLEALLPVLERQGAERVILAPLLLTAGTHAREDIAGPGPESWKSRLEAAGLTVHPVLEGLGRLPQVQGLYVRRLEQLLEG